MVFCTPEALNTRRYSWSTACRWTRTGHRRSHQDSALPKFRASVFLQEIFRPSMGASWAVLWRSQLRKTFAKASMALRNLGAGALERRAGFYRDHTVGSAAR